VPNKSLIVCVFAYVGRPAPRPLWLSARSQLDVAVAEGRKALEVQVAAVQAHRHDVYDPAKARVDGVRAQLHLPRMPSIEEDTDAAIAQYGHAAS
jgi:hypothetical protein